MKYVGKNATWIIVKVGLSLETMTLLLGGTIPCAEMCSHFISKWFQICRCPNRPYSGAQAARMHVHAWSYARSSLSCTDLGRAIQALLVCSTHEALLQHRASDCIMALCNWEQKTAVTAEPSCSDTSVFQSYSARNSSRSTSLKNVQNDLLWYHRSNQERPSWQSGSGIHWQPDVELKKRLLGRVNHFY